MIRLGLPVLYALFLWWFSTGVIFYLDSRPRWTFPLSFAAVTLVAAAAVLGIVRTSAEGAAIDAFADFTYGLVLWGWLETGFYMGFMIGPRRTAPERPATGWRRLREAIATTLYHELAAAATAAVIAAICWDMPNKLALWTFLLLWVMQLSAKLNVFLGVPNLSEHLLPAHLAFLRRYMTRKPMNPVFPLTVTSATAAATALAHSAITSGSGDAAAAFAMLGTLTALAVLEHWMLVLPVRIEPLWQWALRRRDGRRGASEARPQGAATGHGGLPVAQPTLTPIVH